VCGSLDERTDYTTVTDVRHEDIKESKLIF